MEIPKIGLKTCWAKDPVQLEQAFIYAIEEVGYRYIDTAHVYLDEEVIGDTLQKIFAKGKVKREEIFITTKLATVNRRPERVEQACRDSLKKLKLDYLDLYLIHSPMASVPQEDGNLFPHDENGKPKT
jgi:diketogulonate reductase-like aldo/keto reductase